MASQTKLTETDRDALERFAVRNGRAWKLALKTCWERGDFWHADAHPDDESILMFLRNARHFGPTGLHEFRRPS